MVIKMLKRIDLTRDYEKHKEEYLEAIKAVCRETAFSGGKFADKFDREFADYCKVPYAAGVNNGTSALHCAMMALGIHLDLYGGCACFCGLHRRYLGNRP